MDRRYCRPMACATMLALASTLAFAQPQASPGAPGTGATVETPATTGAGAPAQDDAIDAQRGADVRTDAAATLRAADQRFLVQAIQLGAAEVQSAQLALQRSEDERIREFAEHMIDEHGPTNQRLIRMAREAGILPPSDTDERHTRALDQLNKHSGQDFDLAFLALQVQMHDEALKLHDRHSRDGQDPALRDMAAAKLPVLREHLRIAQGLQPGPRGDTSDTADTPGTVGATGTVRERAPEVTPPRPPGSLNMER